MIRTRRDITTALRGRTLSGTKFSQAPPAETPVTRGARVKNSCKNMLPKARRLFKICFKMELKIFRASIGSSCVNASKRGAINRRGPRRIMSHNTRNTKDIIGAKDNPGLSRLLRPSRNIQTDIILKNLVNRTTALLPLLNCAK